ncbi:hypothetical protein FHX82_001628 [Amycolatopsis bartoniae]|uniref:Uncharacterized protein n=1 Tax=Amycolatopsis bartoniae TaxID=941986 RepID=A0A8H9IUW1_9PSEU|nr:hypothetical protein [Amycolatopsis bartoniae]MBB2934608.1 hypothetical protein [Amycolatopsis bartoniae]TVT06931.1 hypothetical protein FNH07_18505 [Amycolatopsis bartoniae]GHF46124.1 hypothetical protein GCM10017566_19000 [Amycolatopsis bartoniae]
MSKILVKIGGVAAAVAVLFGVLLGGVAQAGVAQAAEPSGTQQRDTAAVQVQPTDETRAVVVGTLSFVLMVALAGGVLWYTARGRHSAE